MPERFHREATEAERAEVRAKFKVALTKVWEEASKDLDEDEVDALIDEEIRQVRAERGLPPLAEEFAEFKRLLPFLLERATGQFVLIKERQLIGLFPQRGGALDEGARRFGPTGFLVREVR